MKIITLSLIAAFSSFTFGFSQNVTVIAPPVNSSTQLRAPNGTAGQTGLRGCYIVPASELTSLTASLITSFGFSLTQGTGSTPVAGSFTLYLENTNSTTYAKGVNWPTILTGMQTAFTGTMTVPANTGTAVVTLPVNFNYNLGSGLYVAFEWSSNGPFSANPATYAANGTLPTGGATIDTPTLPTPVMLITSNFRPSFIFSGVNTATNEISVIGLEAPGKLFKLSENSQTGVAYVRNGGSIVKNNVAVTLTVSGANSFTDTKTIASLAPGAVESVTFDAFPSPNSGINTMSVIVAPDQINSNNLARWTQSVTCQEASFSPPLTAINYSAQGYGFGNNSASGGIYAFRYLTGASASVTAVRTAVPSFTQNIGKQLFAVVLDDQANIIATGNTVTISAGNFNTFMNLSFTPPVDLTASTEYFIGLRITAGNTFPIGVLPSDFPIQSFYTAPDIGGSITQVNFGYLGLEGVFTSPAIVMKISSAKSLICQGEAVTLTASGGATTYTWSANVGTLTNVASVMVTPTNTGNTIYTINGTNGPSGCRTTAASITQSVGACTGIANNSIGFNDLRIFPNPAVNGKAEIIGLSGLNTITIFNLLGQLITTQKTEKENFQIDLNNQPNGTYLVKIVNANHDSKVVKIVNEN